MTSAEITKRGRYWAERLNLSHWDIDVVMADQLSKPDTVAECYPSDDYDSATILLHQHLEMMSDQEPEDALDYTLIHELLHCHLRGCDQTVEGMLGVLGPLAGNGHRLRWSHEEEGLIDRLAQAILVLDKQTK